LKTDLDTEQEAISLRAIVLMVSAASQLGLIVLDARRNNPFLAKLKRSIATRGVERGLRRVEPMNNAAEVYGEVGLEINFLFRNVRDEVIATTGNEQEPYVYQSLSKQAIYLKPPAVPAASSGPDQAAWQLLRETTDEAALKRFTALYPESPLRQEAEARIAALETARTAKAVRPGADEITWLMLKGTSDEEALKRFAPQYPSSSRHKDAEARIVELAAAEAAKSGPQLVIAWNMVKDSKEPDLLRRFIDQFPNSAARTRAEKQLTSLAGGAARPSLASAPESHELARSLQLEPKRVGCFDGNVNGEFDDATKAAWRKFTKLTAVNLLEGVSSDAINAVRGIGKRICPLACPAGSHAEDELCVTNPPPQAKRERVRAVREAPPAPRPRNTWRNERTPTEP
jgi:hypothetical protein